MHQSHSSLSIICVKVFFKGYNIIGLWSSFVLDDFFNEDLKKEKKNRIKRSKFKN